MSAIGGDIGEVAFMQFLQDNGVVDPTPLDDGRWAGLWTPEGYRVAPWSILSGETGDLMGFHDKVWRYPDRASAEAALRVWIAVGGDAPMGWTLAHEA